MTQWKEIKGFEGLYKVSDTGLVKSIERVVLEKNGRTKRIQERVLKVDTQITKHTSYLRVTLSKNGETKRYSVHRLVAEAFIENPENKPFVNHIDNDATNNNVSNLEWVTHSENMKHAQNHGRLFKAQSKAGTNAGIRAKKIVLEKISKMEGNYYGSWEVIDTNHVYRGGKYYVTCRCVCGTSKLVEYSRLTRKETLGCSKRCYQV